MSHQKYLNSPFRAVYPALLFRRIQHASDLLKFSKHKTARYKVGEIWIILLQPLDSESVPGKHLQQYGEGFFLISYEVENLKAAMKNINDKGGTLKDKRARHGILNWQVADIDPDSTIGVLTQLVEEKN